MTNDRAASDDVLESLVRAAQQGDQLAMSELMDRLLPSVARWCGPIALEHRDDAAQEALIAIFRGLRGLGNPAALYGWARTVAVREAVRVAKREKRRSAVPLEDVPDRDDPVLAIELRETLARLSPEHRAVLVLRDLEGLDEATASELLKVPPGTVKSRLSRARSRFRREWQE